MVNKKWSPANDTSHSNVKMNENKRKGDQQIRVVPPEKVLHSKRDCLQLSKSVHESHRMIGLNQNSALNSFREPPHRKSVKNLPMKQHGYYKSKNVNKNVQLNVEQNCSDLSKSNKKSDKKYQRKEHFSLPGFDNEKLKSQRKIKIWDKWKKFAFSQPLHKKHMSNIAEDKLWAGELKSV